VTSEERRAYHRAYNAQHWPEQYARTKEARINVHGPRRRAKLRGAYVEDVDRRVVWERDRGRCQLKIVCTGRRVPFRKMHMDHIIPLARGGEHSYANVQTSCGPCNLAKGSAVLKSRRRKRRRRSLFLWAFAKCFSSSGLRILALVFFAILLVISIT
jgi:5-methylcytosine-specific restriction endonuclease McrA